MYKNSISKLSKILPPPNNPLDCDEEVFERNKIILRIDFPADFVEFGRVYGSGTIRTCYDWEVWSPFRRGYPLIVMEFARVWQIFKEAMEIQGVPFGIFPETGGVMPFAMTGDGDWVCWITKGEPDDWKVVDMHNYEEGQYEILDMNFSNYFLQVLTGKVVLERHRGGPSWKPSDIQFQQNVFKDAWR